MEREAALQTREQRYAVKRRDAMYVPKSLVVSSAWWTLGEAACKVLLIFFTKRHIEQVRVEAKPGKREKEFMVVNNGEIVFTYAEAQKEYGVSAGRFRRAIDELVDVGFLDIAHSALGIRRDASRYALSDRWKDFGTDRFVVAQRSRRGIRVGFRKGNRFGQNARGGE